ncbi:MAG: hypothetical protein ACK4M9_17120 [Anaerobacillus sp.]|uniref:hypothetical protein n=1 Tax=Anaerobacillus sp. TaxID=1872506 RepID=UPI00391AA147
MKKIILFIFLTVFIPATLFGCQSESNSEFQASDILAKVSISRSTGFGKVNSDFFVVYKDDRTLEIFSTVFSTAVQEEGIVNIAEPEFDLEVIYEDGTKQELHLWVGTPGQRSTLMNISNTNTIYTVSKEMTAKLIDLVQ